MPRKLFWRYKINDQQAARDGDWKYLKILDNTFLFDVVQDPMERANLKERHKDVYDRLVAQWNEWNTTMLPLNPQSFTDGFTGASSPTISASRRMRELSLGANDAANSAGPPMHLLDNILRANAHLARYGLARG